VSRVLESGELTLAHAAPRPFWRVETGFFLGIWLFLMVAGRDRLFRDPGTFWHTVVGRRILTSGRFFDTDPFSFTFSGRPWIPHQWLGECLMAVLDGVGGLDTLLLATATVLAGLYAWAAHRLLRSGLHWLPTALLIAVTVAGSASHLHVRPHISTIVFMGLTFGWLCDLDARRIVIGRLCWLIPVFWVWSNMHGAALGGLATAGLAVAGWSLASLAGRAQTQWTGRAPIVRLHEVPLLILLIAACGLTAVVNPYGLRLPQAWLEIMESPVLPRIIQEHAPLDLGTPEGWLIGSLGLTYAGALASVRPWWPRVTWLLPSVWFLLALMRVRHAPLFYITATLALAEMLPYTRLAAMLARPGRDLFQFRSSDPVLDRDVSWRAAIFPLGLVLITAALQATGVRAPLLGHGWVKLDPEYWPVELLPELRQVEQEHPEGTRVFNDLNYGGYLIGYTPRIKVFIDDRCELYGDWWLLEFVEARTRYPERVESWAQEYQIEYALVESGSPFDRYLQEAPSWVLQRRSQPAALYRRR
jgi:hypothetical protein